MSDNKLVKTLTNSANLTELATTIGLVAKKVIKEPMTSDLSSNLMLSSLLLLLHQLWQKVS